MARGDEKPSQRRPDRVGVDLYEAIRAVRVARYGNGGTAPRRSSAVGSVGSERDPSDWLLQLVRRELDEALRVQMAPRDRSGDVGAMEESAVFAERRAVACSSSSTEEKALRECFAVLRDLVGDQTNQEIAAIYDVDRRTVQRAKERFAATTPDMGGRRAEQLEESLSAMYNKLSEQIQRGADRDWGPWLTVALFESPARSRPPGRPPSPRAREAAIAGGPAGGVIARVRRAADYYGVDEQARDLLIDAVHRFGRPQPAPLPKKGLERNLRITMIREIARIGYRDLGAAFGMHPDSCRRTVDSTQLEYPELQYLFGKLHAARLDERLELIAIDNTLRASSAPVPDEPFTRKLALIDRERTRLKTVGALPNDRRAGYAAKVTSLHAEMAQIAERFEFSAEAQERVALIVDAWASRKPIPAGVPPLRPWRTPDPDATESNPP